MTLLVARSLRTTAFGLRSTARGLVAAIALLFAVPAIAQTAPTGNPTLSSRAVTGGREVCIQVRGTNVCDPLGTVDAASGNFTPSAVNVPYTNAMLNTNNDAGIVVRIGTLPQSLEFASIDASGANHTTSGITCALASPSGTSGYTGMATWPDGCFASYVIANHTQKSAINYLAYGGVGRDGGFVQLFNGVATNKALGPDSGTGVNAAHVNGPEIDFNILELLGGGGMTGDVLGYQAFLSAPTSAAINSLAGNIAFRAVGVNAGKWNAAFDAEPGAANIILLANPVTVTGPSDAQAIFLKSLNSSGVSQTAQIGYDSGANLLLLNISAGETFGLFSAYPQLQYSQSLAGAVGLKIKNTAAGAGVTSNSILETGTANSFYQVSLLDAGDTTLSTGNGRLILSPASTLKITKGLSLDTLNGYTKANTTGLVTASPTIPASDLSGTLAENHGGTGQASYTIGDLLFASGATTLSKLSDIATGNVLRSGGVGAAPAWGKINLSTDLDANTLPAANSAALAGDVTKIAGANNTAIAANVVTYAKFQQVSASRLLGNPAGSLANASEISLGAALAFSGPVLQTVAFSGDCTTPANSVALTCTKTNGVAFSVAATTAIGTSGATIPLNNAANTFSAKQIIQSTGVSSASQLDLIDTQSLAGGAGGLLRLQGMNGSAAVTSFAAVKAYVTGGTAGSETGDVVLQATRAGALTDVIRGRSVGDIVLQKLSGAPGAAPGAGAAGIFVVAGTNAGSCKVQVFAGNSATPVTIVDNVGIGC